MAQKTLDRVAVLQSNSHPIKRIHSISALYDGSTVLMDQGSRELKVLQSGVAVKVPLKQNFRILDFCIIL